LSCSGLTLIPYYRELHVTRTDRFDRRILRRCQKRGWTVVRYRKKMTLLQLIYLLNRQRLGPKLTELIFDESPLLKRLKRGPQQPITMPIVLTNNPGG